MYIIAEILFILDKYYTDVCGFLCYCVVYRYFARHV